MGAAARGFAHRRDAARKALSWRPARPSATILADGCSMRTRPPEEDAAMRHDEVFKAIFSHRISVEHLLRFLAGMIDDGPEWIAAFDPETLEPVPTERIDEALHRHLSDLVWRVRLRDGGEGDWAYLFVLIELQSAVDHLMAFRVRTYVDLLYRGLLAGRRFGASDRLPPVLPIVLYNGKPPWSAAASVEELVAPAVRPSGPVVPVPFYAGASYVTLDVGRVGGGDFPPNDVLSLVIGIERMSSYDEGYATLREAFSVLRGPEHRELRRTFHTWFTMLAGQGSGGALIEEFEEMERIPEEGEMRTPVQDRVRAWREADREQGRAEIIEQERALLRRLTERKFGADTAERAVPLLAGIGEPERLADVGEWIIDCASGDELIARLEGAG